MNADRSLLAIYVCEDSDAIKTLPWKKLIDQVGLIINDVPTPANKNIPTEQEIALMQTVWEECLSLFPSHTGNWTVLLRKKFKEHKNSLK